MPQSNSINDELVAHLCRLRPNGEQLIELWEKCTIAVDKIILAHTLNYCTRMHLLYKEAGKYYTDPIVKARKSRAKAGYDLVRRTEAIPKTIYGTLPRGNITSRVALALFVHREAEHLLVPDLIEIIGDPDLKILGALGKLCATCYAYKRNTLDGYAYKWTQYYDYPFESFWPSDLKLIKNIPDNFSFKPAR